MRNGQKEWDKPESIGSSARRERLDSVITGVQCIVIGSDLICTTGIPIPACITVGIEQEQDTKPGQDSTG